MRFGVFASSLVASSAHVLNELQITSQVSQMLDAVSSSLLDPEHSKFQDMGSAMRSIEAQMDVPSAAKFVGGKSLSSDVQQLVQGVADNKADAGFAAAFSEESLAKARKALNELIEKAWIELDDKIMVCKGFEDMNRENYGQVTRDIARLIQQINDLERIESESVEGINEKDMEIKAVEDLIEKETKAYNAEYATNSAQLTIHQNDLDVFQFIMVFTKCEDATSLAQAQVCQTHDGSRLLMFHDSALNTKYQKMLTATAKKEVSRLLTNMARTRTANKTDPPLPPKAKEPIQDGMSSIEASLACNPDSVPDCALLHDKLSLMWGEFKDKVDELTMIMMKNEFEFGELKSNLNNQIEMLKAAKARLNQLLGEARSNMAADNEELKQKYMQKEELDIQYTKFMAACKKRINWIFYQDMCAIKIVRNAVMENSTECPTAEMTDCDVADWVAEECSVSCDDSCDPALPYKCGGWQEMKREVIVPNDDCGVKCPRLSLFKRCGQYHCPIDCHMSEWSGWSKCTAECGGGLQSHTRSILMKPKNGGLSCNTVEESRPCATISCDRDCALASWTKWTPCSVACDGGFKERFRHVARPIRGFGKCPQTTSSFRYSKSGCNEQRCKGDEICVAKQDLIVAVDGSGSVRAAGFDILKKFIEKLLGRYRTEFWGAEAVKIGIVLFGNGVIMPDGKTVSPAILAQPLSFDMAAIETVVKDLPFKKGFTNMAQAFSSAETGFIQGSRRGAQSSIMVVTDGKPSFNFMTSNMISQLEDKGINRYFLLVNEEDLSSDSNRLMKSWASQPWETNLVHVPGGLALLESDMDLWADKALVKFCPNSFSPTEAEYAVDNYGYALIKKGGFCGEMKDELLLTDAIEGAEQCAALATGTGATTFMIGISFAKGKCYAGTLPVDEALWKKWDENRVSPECTEGDGWKSTTLFDYYAIKPSSTTPA